MIYYIKWFTVAVKDLYLPNSIFLLHIFIAGNIYQILTFFKTNDHLFNIKNIFNTLQPKRIFKGSFTQKPLVVYKSVPKVSCHFWRNGGELHEKKNSMNIWWTLVPKKPAFARKQKRHQKVCIKKVCNFSSFDEI